MRLKWPEIAQTFIDIDFHSGKFFHKDKLFVPRLSDGLLA